MGGIIKISAIAFDQAEKEKTDTLDLFIAKFDDIVAPLILDLLRQSSVFS
jgi:hypothetical protein